MRVKNVGFDEGPVASVQLLPNLRVLGPRLGRKLPEVRAALAAGDVEQLGDGRLIVAGEELGPDDVIRGQRVALEGWAIAEDDGISVAFDTTLDEALRLEGRVYDLVHAVNEMRKEHGLALTGRITLTLPERDHDLLVHEEWIRAEVLATEIALDPEIREPTIRPHVTAGPGSSPAPPSALAHLRCGGALRDVAGGVAGLDGQRQLLALAQRGAGAALERQLDRALAGGDVAARGLDQASWSPS